MERATNGSAPAVCPPKRPRRSSGGSNASNRCSQSRDARALASRCVAHAQRLPSVLEQQDLAEMSREVLEHVIDDPEHLDLAWLPVGTSAGPHDREIRVPGEFCPDIATGRAWAAHHDARVTRTVASSPTASRRRSTRLIVTFCRLPERMPVTAVRGSPERAATSACVRRRRSISRVTAAINCAFSTASTPRLFGMPSCLASPAADGLLFLIMAESPSPCATRAYTIRYAPERAFSPTPMSGIGRDSGIERCKLASS